MSQRDVETVKRMFDAFARRDLEALREVLHPDVRFTAQATAELAGRSGPYRGHEGIGEYFADASRVWEDLVVEPMDYRAVAGSVVIFGWVRGLHAGEKLETGAVWTWRLRDGLVVSGSVFPTPDAPGKPGGAPGAWAESG